MLTHSQMIARIISILKQCDYGQISIIYQFVTHLIAR